MGLNREQREALFQHCRVGKVGQGRKCRFDRTGIELVTSEPIGVESEQPARDQGVTELCSLSRGRLTLRKAGCRMVIASFQGQHLILVHAQPLPWETKPSNNSRCKTS